MNYYRKTVDNVVDNVKLKMQMGALTLKLSENNGNISSNLSKINTNRDNITSNLTTLNNIDNDLFSLRGRINTHQNDIQNINSNINDIKENNLKISNKVFNERYDIVNLSFNFNENIHSYKLFEKVIEESINTGELIINTIIKYKYDNLKNDLNRLTHLYQFYNDKNELFYSITLDNHDFSTISVSDENILNIDDNFCFKIKNKNNIKIVLSLTRINQWGTGNIQLKMVDNNSINIIYKEKTNVSDKFDEHDKKLKLLMIKFHQTII